VSSSKFRLSYSCRTQSDLHIDLAALNNGFFLSFVVLSKAMRSVDGNGEGFVARTPLASLPQKSIST
jgi:hypothetical protein